MFGLKKRGPTRPFTHADNCKIFKADPTVQIQWSEVETGHWRAVCQCGSEDAYEEPTDRCDRLDPYDPSTFRHAGQWEFASETDPAVLRILLKVQDGRGGDYWWVTCGGCECSWQAPFNAVSAERAETG